MFVYEKRISFPINITKTDLKMANSLYAQLGGPNGELGPCLRYFAQSFTMPDERGRQLLKDIATEEMGHVEMICTMINMLTKNASPEDFVKEGFSCSYVTNGKAVGLHDCNGVNFSTDGIGITGDYKADLTEDMAAEERARANYEHLIDISTNPEVTSVLLFLRQREIVHYNRFKDLLKSYQEKKTCPKKCK